MERAVGASQWKTTRRKSKKKGELSIRESGGGGGSNTQTQATTHLLVSSLRCRLGASCTGRRLDVVGALGHEKVYHQKSRYRRHRRHKEQAAKAFKAEETCQRDKLSACRDQDLAHGKEERPADHVKCPVSIRNKLRTESAGSWKNCARRRVSVSLRCNTVPFFGFACTRTCTEHTTELVTKTHGNLCTFRRSNGAPKAGRSS